MVIGHPRELVPGTIAVSKTSGLPVVARTLPGGTMGYVCYVAVKAMPVPLPNPSPARPPLRRGSTNPPAREGPHTTMPPDPHRLSRRSRSRSRSRARRRRREAERPREAHPREARRPADTRPVTLYSVARDEITDMY